MPSSEPVSRHLIDPLTPISELVGWFTSLMMHIALGVTVGLVAAHFMRCRRVRWTWAASTAVVLMLVRPMLGISLTMLDAAAICATLRARHRHLEDTMAGGDLSEVATASRGPLAVLRSITQGAAGRLRSQPTQKTLYGGRMVVGRDGSGAVTTIPFATRDSGRHTLIVGATGSGKTVSQTWIASRAIEAGLGAVVIDPKGDARMRAHLVDAAAERGRRFLEWTTRGPSVYNPFGHGSASEIADKALAGERFTEPHYQRQAQRYLGHAIRALHGTGTVVSLSALVAQLDPGELEVLARALPEDEASATNQYLDSLTARQRTDLGGVRDRLAIIAESDFARWLDPATPGAPVFDLLGAIRERAVVYFALEADSLPLLSHMLAVAIVQDLQTTMATLQRAPVETVVVIDEFAAIAAEQVVRLFGRARSAGINLLLGTQELADLRLDGHRQLQEQVLGNLSSVIAHRQVVPDSAELISSLAGSRGDWRTSQASDGRWTRTRRTIPRLASEDVCALPPGRAAVIELGAAASTRIVDVFSSIPSSRRRSSHEQA
jgi:type IV secretory pathway TraG/TraD family ATPase VirD4